MKNRSIYILAVIICSIVLLSAPAFATIVLELHSDTTNGSATFTDSSNPAHVITTVGGAHHSTAVLDNFGGASTSMSFGGAGDYLSSPYSNDWNFGSGDFTIDYWIYFLNVDSSWKSPVINFQENTNQRSFAAGIGATNGAFNFDIWMTDASNCRLTANVSVGQWYHIAYVRNGSNLCYYLDGNSVNSADIAEKSLKNVSSQPLLIGEDFYGYTNSDLNAYIDDLYIRQGEGLTANEIDYIYNFGGESLEALEQYVRASVASIGNDAYLDLTSGLNDGGTNQLSLSYTTQEISQLAEVYSDGTGSVTVGDLTWSYVEGILPGDTGGTLYNVGDAYTHDGKWYIKLGSGLEGVPEVPKGAVLFMAMVFGIVSRVRKKLGLSPVVHGSINKTCYKK